MNNVVTQLVVKPNYGNGFSFSWQVYGGLADPGPWQFTVYESPTTPDKWVAVSPTLTNVFEWSDTVRRIPDKDAILYFKVVMVTPKGTYESPVVAPWGVLNRKDYLLGKDIMRREVLHAKKMAGILGSAWIRNVYGPKCKVCTDPVTGVVRNSKCPSCLGTGYSPAYHGPYSTWFTFSPKEVKLEFAEEGNGTYQDRGHTVRTIGTIHLRKNDVLIDIDQDKRYIVMASKFEAELRRVPLVQTVLVSEAPTTDIIYKLIK